MKRHVHLLVLCSILSLAALNVARGEEKDWYFPIVLMDNGGTKCTTGETMIIYPGSVDGVKGGETLPVYIKDNGNYKQIAEVFIEWSDMWESKAKAKMLPGNTFMTMECLVKVKCDIDKSFEFWWKKGTDWEKVKDFYYAFRAYYRCLIYRPTDPNVDAAYRRSGHFDYVTQAQSAMKSGRFRSAISLFKKALDYPYPGWDRTICDEGIKKCESQLGKANDFDDRLKNAEAALAAKEYLRAMYECRVAWMSHALPFGSPEEQAAIKKIIAAAWPKAWSAVKGEADRAINARKGDEAYRKLVQVSKYIPFVENWDPTAFNDLFKKAVKALPEKCPERTAFLGLSYIASLQNDSGWFAVAGETEPNESSAILTGLALAAFSYVGNTKRSGYFKDTVAKATNWVLSVRKDDGAFFMDDNTTVHIFLTYGLSEQYLASGDDAYPGSVRGGIDLLSSRCKENGTFVGSAAWSEPVLEQAIVALALGNGFSSGVLSTGVLADTIRTAVYKRVDPEKAIVMDFQGKEIPAGSADEVFALGAALATIRGSGGSMVGKYALPLVKKAIATRANFDKNAPHGWLLTSWALSAFPVEEWAGYAGSVLSQASEYPKSTAEFGLPTPVHPIFGKLGQPGAAIFLVLAVHFSEGIE